MKKIILSLFMLIVLVIFPKISEAYFITNTSNWVDNNDCIWSATTVLEISDIDGSLVGSQIHVSSDCGDCYVVGAMQVSVGGGFGSDNMDIDMETCDGGSLGWSLSDIDNFWDTYLEETIYWE